VTPRPTPGVIHTDAGCLDNREGFDVRRFSSVRPRLDWSGFLRERYAKAALGEDQTAAIRWLIAQPGGPAKILVLSEDWSSDCRILIDSSSHAR